MVAVLQIISISEAEMYFEYFLGSQLEDALAFFFWNAYVSHTFSYNTSYMLHFPHRYETIPFQLNINWKISKI